MDIERSVRLRPAKLEDRFTLRRWLSDATAQYPMRTAAGAEAEFTLAMETATALPRIVERDGIDIGYAQAIEIGLWPEGTQDRAPAGTWDVFFFLASPMTGDVKIGGRVLSLLTEEVFATTLAVACSGLVSIRYEAVVRAYEQAGFHWRHVVQDPSIGPAWLMLKERRPLQTR